MKLLSTTALFLTSLMITSTLANFHIEFENLPSKLRAGATYEVKWTASQDYQVDDFLLVHEVPNQGGWGPVHVIDHYLNMTGGDHKMLWEVPALKNQRRYGLYLRGSQIPDVSVPTYNATSYADLTNWFEITGGPALYPREIAGVVVGTLGACALIIAAVVFVPRCVRKRRSVAVNLA